MFRELEFHIKQQIARELALITNNAFKNSKDSCKKVWIYNKMTLKNLPMLYMYISSYSSSDSLLCSSCYVNIMLKYTYKNCCTFFWNEYSFNIRCWIELFIQVFAFLLNRIIMRLLLLETTWGRIFKWIRENILLFACRNSEVRYLAEHYLQHDIKSSLPRLRVVEETVVDILEKKIKWCC